MCRNFFLFALIVLLTSCQTSNAPKPLANAPQVRDGDEVRWHFSTWGKPRAFSSGIEAMKSYVAAKSAGKFKIEIHYGAKLARNKDNLEGVSDGDFEMANFCAALHPDKTPALYGLELPFLPIADAEVLLRVQKAYYSHPAVVGELKGWNAKALFPSLLPPYGIMGVGTPPARIDAWKGMSVRALNMTGDAMRHLGATVQSLPASKVRDALQSEEIDAATFPYPSIFVAYRVHEVADWDIPGISVGTLNCPVVVNQTAYNRLPATYRRILDDSIEHAYEAMRSRNKQSLDRWKTKRSPSIVRIEYTPAQRQEIAERVRPVWEDWVESMEARGLPGRQLLDFILSQAKAASTGS